MEEELEPKGEFMLTVSSLPQANIKVPQSHFVNILLVEFENLFVEPNSLAPTRHIDHTINLKLNTNPVNVHAYLTKRQK